MWDSLVYSQWNLLGSWFSNFNGNKPSIQALVLHGIVVYICHSYEAIYYCMDPKCKVLLGQNSLQCKSMTISFLRKTGASHKNDCTLYIYFEDRFSHTKLMFGW
jgi:hypothetical protein